MHHATDYHLRVRRASFEAMNCSIAQCLEVVGEWWSFLILREAFFGVTRFDDFRERLGIARNTLDDRLGALVDAGVLERVAYSEHPPRYDYRLTTKGKDLWPVLAAMRQWGDRWAAPHGPPVEYVHRTCRQVVQVLPKCSGCGEPLALRDLRVVIGPGGGDIPVLPAQAS